MKQIRNNLYHIKHPQHQYNFFTTQISIKNKHILIRKSLRIKNQINYSDTRPYIRSSFAPVLYYCPYCNHFRKINFCKCCKKSINDDFDSESNKTTTLSSITIITEESQKSLKNKGIFDDVIKKYFAKYITSQSGTVENEISFEAKYRLLLSNYLLTCDLEEKYLATLSHLTLVEKCGIPVRETKNAIETQLVIQSNLKKKYKEMITTHKIDSREFFLVVPITLKKQILISKRINPNKDYFDYYHVPTGKRKRNETFNEYTIREMKEETRITIKELFYVGINERFQFELNLISMMIGFL
ncbi:26809_t:CDS:2 [Dentiscutata erythropus]|uniref:26809_t:CDS:1 n=1 Tax=Dentiscutata erythropus TaxID=1348616 RepID=A0A9N9DCF7_9GLOM|nr:26809_t:CDS:2 [Dentiscutata erythropus]